MIIKEEYPFSQETEKIIGACFEVHRILGNGFLESVYQEALTLEFGERGIEFEPLVKLNISYKGQQLEKFFTADFICYETIILEIKALSNLASEHTAQVLNYLKATDLTLGLLINFGSSRVQIKRVVL